MQLYAEMLLATSDQKAMAVETAEDDVMESETGDGGVVVASGRVVVDDDDVPLDYVDAEELSQLLTSPVGSDQLVLIDCRSYLTYSESHIVSSHNVCYPAILERRRQRTCQLIPLQNIIRCADVLQKAVNSPSCMFVVYDQSTSCPSLSLDCSGHVPVQPSASKLLLVLRSLASLFPVQRIRYLLGGFESFSATSPELLRSDRWQAESVVPRRHCNDTVRCHPSTDQGDPVEVLPWLFLGNAYHATREDRLAHLGVSALLCIADNECRADSDVGSQHICHINISVTDSSTSDISCWFPQAIDFIESVRQSGGKVLVHCLAGISRSATICIAYLMYSGRLTLDQAHDYLKQCRPLISPNLNFMQQLAQFESKLLAGKGNELHTASSDICYRVPSSDLISSVTQHCASFRNTGDENDRRASDTNNAHADRHANSIALSSKLSSGRLSVGGYSHRNKRSLAVELVLPCGPSPAKMCRVSSIPLQPPPTPCTKQSFTFDLQTVTMMMMAAHSPGVISPNVCHSPLVSPS